MPPTLVRFNSRRAVDALASVPDDLLFHAILSPVFSDAGDVARCAAVCRRWGRIVAEHEAAILRLLPPPDRFLPHLALGFFHELRVQTRADGVALSVCNPMTGDAALVPSVAGDDFPGHDYACALLTADDLDDDAAQRLSLFSRLVLVYNRRSFTALRCYNSDDAGSSGGWGPEFRKPGAQISGHELHRLGPATAGMTMFCRAPPEVA